MIVEAKRRGEGFTGVKITRYASPVSQHLRVPKRRVPVEVALAGHAARPAEVFLAETSAHSHRPERLSDLLDGATSFVPVLEDGRAALLGRSSLLWVSVDNGVLEEDELELFSHRKKVTLELRDGSSLEGELLYTAPMESARVADFLNGHDRCFRVWQASRTYFVIKEHVLRVVED